MECFTLKAQVLANVQQEQSLEICAWGPSSEGPEEQSVRERELVGHTQAHVSAHAHTSSYKRLLCLFQTCEQYLLKTFF